MFEGEKKMKNNCLSNHTVMNNNKKKIYIEIFIRRLMKINYYCYSYIYKWNINRIIKSDGDEKKHEITAEKKIF